MSDILFNQRVIDAVGGLFIPYIGANQDINFGVYSILDNSNNVSLNPNTRQLFLPDATAVVEWQDMLLKDSAASRSIDWDNKLLYDDSAANSIDWNNRILVDASSNTSLEWGTTRILRDLATQQSIDWDIRKFFDAPGNESLNYNSRTATDSATRLSIDWDNRSLRGSNDRDAILWDNHQLLEDWAVTGSFGIAAKINSYNGISTVSNGVPSELATADLTAQVAAKAVTTIYAVPAAKNGMYRVSFVASITTAASTSSVLGGANGFQIKYTDQNDSVVKISPAGLQLSSVNTTATQISGVFIANCKASTNLQYSFDYTSVGVTPMAYNLHVKVEAL